MAYSLSRRVIFPDSRPKSLARCNRVVRVDYNSNQMRQVPLLIELSMALMLAGGLVSGQPAAPRDALRDAAAAHDAGDIPAAVKLYREFLREHPDAAQIRSNLGAALARNGQFEEAIAEYSRALRQLPGNPRVIKNLALAYYKLGRLPEAIEHLIVLIRLQPGEREPALLLADCYLLAGQPLKAADVLAPFEEEFPDDKAVVYLYGMALLRADRTREAQALLDRILRDGESAEAEFLLGQTEHQAQNNLVSAEHLERSIKLNPALPGVHSLYGLVLHSIAKLDAEPEQYRQELKINPFDFTANVQLAAYSKDEGNLDQALTYAERALQVRPGDPGALFQLASIHQLQGKAEVARGELEQLVKAYPDFTEAHVALAMAYYRLKQKDKGDLETALIQRLRQEEVERLEKTRQRSTPLEAPAAQPVPR